MKWFIAAGLLAWVPGIAVWLTTKDPTILVVLGWLFGLLGCAAGIGYCIARGLEERE